MNRQAIIRDIYDLQSRIDRRFGVHSKTATAAKFLLAKAETEKRLLDEKDAAEQDLEDETAANAALVEQMKGGE